jgi:hypothetical protein
LAPEQAIHRLPRPICGRHIPPWRPSPDPPPNPVNQLSVAPLRRTPLASLGAATNSHTAHCTSARSARPGITTPATRSPDQWFVLVYKPPTGDLTHIDHRHTTISASQACEDALTKRSARRRRTHSPARAGLVRSPCHRPPHPSGHRPAASAYPRPRLRWSGTVRRWTRRSAAPSG